MECHHLISRILVILENIDRREYKDWEMHEDMCMLEFCWVYVLKFESEGHKDDFHEICISSQPCTRDAKLYRATHCCGKWHSANDLIAHLNVCAFFEKHIHNRM